MRIRLDYGTEGLLADFPEQGVTVIEPHYVAPAPDAGLALAKAVQAPIGKRPLRDLVKPGQKIGISVCDITRAQPRQSMIEALVSEMPGVQMEDVTVFIATGTHRANT